MRTLLLLRHGKSSWSDPSLSDHDRPLKKRGKRDAARMGAHVLEEGLAPDAIVSSTAARAAATAALFAEACEREGLVRLDERLYHGAPDDYVDAVREVEPWHDPVLLVGHNPGMEELVAVLAGEIVRMPTAALARVSIAGGSWRDVVPARCGALVDLWLPREIGR